MTLVFLISETFSLNVSPKIPIFAVFIELNIDFLSLGAHKFYGPKGIGALYIKSGVSVNPILIGGGQEKGISPVTENVSLISGMAYALELSINKIQQKIRT